jgi:hypothetical protein
MLQTTILMIVKSEIESHIRLVWYVNLNFTRQYKNKMSNVLIED